MKNLVMVAFMLSVAGCLESTETDSADDETDSSDDETAPLPADEEPVDEPEEEPVVEPEASHSEQVCDALENAASSIPGVSECSTILAADCDRIVGTFSETLVDATAACVREGGAPLDCLAAGFEGLRPTPAHYALADAFCSECVLDVPGCEDAFYFGPDDAWGVGMVALPFSDEVVREITETCTGSWTCGLDFPGCARDVIEARLVPEASLDCLLETVGG